MISSDHRSDTTADAPSNVVPVVTVADARTDLFQHEEDGHAFAASLEALLPGYLAVQRWFGAKDQTIISAVVQEHVRLQAVPLPFYLTTLQVDLPDRAEYYLLPLAIARGDDVRTLQRLHPHSLLACLQTPDGAAAGLVHDATANPAFWRTLLRWWQTSDGPPAANVLSMTDLDEAIRTAPLDEVRIYGGEQSNSLAFFDDRFCLKLYRRLEPGINPETELLEHLTRAGFAYAPRLYGILTFRNPNRTFVLGTLQQALTVETDGWTYALAMTQRFLDRVAALELSPPLTPPAPRQPAPAWLEQTAPEMLRLARVLGARTAELHRVLASADAPDLRPEPGTPHDTHLLAQRLREEIRQTRRMLSKHPGTLHHMPSEEAWQQALQRLDHIEHTTPTCRKIRVHGDYHLGQIVYANGAFYLLDFEGEPARSIDERRARDCSLRDVAGLLRSIEYAVLSAWQDYRVPHTAEEDTSLGLKVSHLVRWCETLFMQTYFAAADAPDLHLPDEAQRRYVWAYLLQKALYEVRYELSHRPAWTWLPLHGLTRLLDESHG